MSNYHLETPVALIIFKRPDATAQVLDMIRRVKPRTLFVIADGPRLDKVDEVEKCRATRAILDQVDWNCEVIKKYSDINLGCGVCPATGISWVFENVDKAIILEDDCLPHLTFFRYCEELLNKYQDDERVMNICGSNFVNNSSQNSYYFSRHSSCWGWATWHRAWQHFDFKMQLLPTLVEEGWFYEFFSDKRVAKFWIHSLQNICNSSKNDVWDFQWQLACWLQNGLSIRPSVNLITNIGFGTDATHTYTYDGSPGKIPSEAMHFPLKHPSYLSQNFRVDRQMERDWMRENEVLIRFLNKFKKALNRI